MANSEQRPKLPRLIYRASVLSCWRKDWSEETPALPNGSVVILPSRSDWAGPAPPHGLRGTDCSSLWRQPPPFLDGHTSRQSVLEVRPHSYRKADSEPRPMHRHLIYLASVLSCWPNGGFPIIGNERGESCDLSTSCPQLLNLCLLC